MKLLSTIPFSGFYESIHNSNIDYAIESMFSDHETGCQVNNELLTKFYSKAKFCDLYASYAESYTKTLAHEFKIKLEFESLKSPKYYNFETDIIYAHIELEEVQRIYNAVEIPRLQELIKDTFTSRSGFISFYPNELEDWPNDLEQWDHNQIGTLLECYCEQESLIDFNNWEVYSMQECIHGLVGRADFGADAWRIVNLHDYLEKRKERKRA